MIPIKPHPDVFNITWALPEPEPSDLSITTEAFTWPINNTWHVFDVNKENAKSVGMHPQLQMLPSHNLDLLHKALPRIISVVDTESKVQLELLLKSMIVWWFLELSRALVLILLSKVPFNVVVEKVSFYHQPRLPHKLFAVSEKNSHIRLIGKCS